MVKISPAATSPPVLAPAGNLQPGEPSIMSQSPISITPVNSITNGPSPPATSLTSKEWVVPPRPKPGRKPATDIPPTKRKAQNRAAQRAFRERRAARVGELEEELRKIEMEDEEEQNALRAHIEKLQKDIEEYRTSLDIWMRRCRALEAELAIERATKEEALKSLKEPSAVLPLPRNEQGQDESLQGNTEQLGCGNCSSISNCRCIQEVINMPGLESDDVVDPSSNKRIHSPGYDSTSKRIKPEPTDDLETDFTSTFTNQNPSNTIGQDSRPSSSSVVADPCGFCTDDTACICAEMQAAEANNSNLNTNHQTPNYQRLDPEQNQTRSIPRVSQLSHITPPPSETDVSLPLPSLPLSSSTTNPCINGPGTCLQCRSDPNSTLFCKSLAKSQQQSSASSSQTQACCGNNGGCCQSQRGTPVPNPRSDEENGPTPTITLSCADAYTTLSRHPGYAKATGEMGRWLPRLHPQPGGSMRLEDRPAMEIDAANVMAVLREFDRRFM